MDATALRALQAPLKERYKQDPNAALVTFRARATLGHELITCTVETKTGPVVAGQHPAAGGTGVEVCSGDLLLEALAACAGVTLNAVATAMGIPLRAGRVRAEGEVDFRGTLGVDKTVPVGFSAIRLIFELDTDAPQEKIEKLVQLTERYCIILQTLAHPPKLSSELVRG